VSPSITIEFSAGGAITIELDDDGTGTVLLVVELTDGGDGVLCLSPAELRRLAAALGEVFE